MEFQAQALLDMSDDELANLKKVADEVGRAIGVWTDLIDDPSVEAREGEALYMLNFVKNY